MSMDTGLITPVTKLSKSDSDGESEFHLPAIRGSVNPHLYINDQEPSLEEFLRISAQHELK